ncbi:MAG: hypothetical protein ACP5K2_07540 [bacterium]
METVAQRVDRLEQVMIELAEQSKITQREVARLSSEMLEFKKEMREFKDEMRAFKDEMRVFKDEMNKRWGDLANKMGTLVEDIFFPSFEIVLKKYFNVTPRLLAHTVKFRKDGKNLEIDILAYTEKEVFIVEVKSSPDRKNYIDEFIEKLKMLPEFMPEINNSKVVPIYAGLSMEESTVELLTEKGIYAMVVKGDILEIVNFESLKDNGYR